MFNDKIGLTQAVLEGRKTQTRRIVPQTSDASFVERGEIEAFVQLFSRYQEGEEVAVAQSYGDCGTWFFPFAEYGNEAGYTNKMFVKADLMIHSIKITNVRVERLQDISAEDCLEEGIQKVDFALKDRGLYSFRYEHEWYKQYNTAQEAFAALIDKVSGKGTWKRNPLVFVYDFELIQ